MTDLPPMPDEDTALPADPLEAELVAYLDGELDPDAARRVEDRLATDPEARAKAASLKKTFDLLDYLPKPEPSPTFATRTLDRLPALSATSAHASASSSRPVLLATRNTRQSQLQAPPVPAVAPTSWKLWAAGILVAVSACAAAGYFASAAFSPHTKDTTDELMLADHRVVENLPLYAAADDIDFVRELGKFEFFGEEPAVVFTMKVPTVEPRELATATFETLKESFKAMPHARQHAVRELDRQLHADKDHDRLMRVLEVYAIWVSQLPDAKRKDLLTATTASRRLDEVRDLRERQWREGLPATQRAQLDGMSAEEKGKLIGQWKADELARREDWAEFRRLAPDMVENRIPWPFDDATRRKEIIEFMRVAYRTDDAKKCRFTQEDYTRYQTAITAAERANGWSWYAYGKQVHELSRKYELFPEPATGDPVTTYAQLGAAGKFFDKEKGPAYKATADKVGKWPEFALVVHGISPFIKGERLPPLGPAKPGDFKEPLRLFVTRDLSAKLGTTEKAVLQGLEGRWPDYPRELVRLAGQHNLTAPGLMPPGPPHDWKTIYGFSPRFPRP